ncbi:MAG: DsrE family protein [Deltaproteobacteria bacterium]|nr:DsrE family protein [Deltaproteobacteria bacterium]
MRHIRFAAVALLVAGCAKTERAEKSATPAVPDARKLLIILQADTDRHEGMARALHALLYAKELKTAGHAVTLVFDGAGTGWAKLMREPKNHLHGKYKELMGLGVVEVICDFCAGAFKVRDDLKQAPGVKLDGEVEGHPSLTKWVAQGYQVIVL